MSVLEILTELLENIGALSTNDAQFINYVAHRQPEHMDNRNERRVKAIWKLMKEGGK